MAFSIVGIRACKCKICGLSDDNFLITSHIKPWSASSDKEKKDPYNCFLLCPNHDALFDKGYISFDSSGKIILSDLLNEQTKVLLNIRI